MIIKLNRSKTFDREVTPLLSIRDVYLKLLIARTYQPEFQHEVCSYYRRS